MNLVFLDLEYNQTSNRRHRVMPFEIIDFGCVITDFQLNTVTELNYLIKPEYQRDIKPKVEKLTGIVARDLSNGINFQYCMERFKQLCGDRFYIMTWGIDDVKVLKQNCFLKKVNCDFLNNVINFNVQKSHQIINNLKNPMSLEKIKPKLSIPSQKQHRAYYDVLDTISVCREIGISNILSHKESIVDNRDIKEEIVDKKMKIANESWNNEHRCFNCKSLDTEILREVKPHFEFGTKSIRGVQLLECKNCGGMSSHKIDFTMSRKTKNDVNSKKVYKRKHLNRTNKIDKIMKMKFYDTYKLNRD